MLSLFDKLYLNRFSEAERKSRKTIWKILCRDFFQKFISESDTVVDMGAGFCEFINFIKAGRKIAVDELTVAQFADSGVEVFSEIEELQDNTADIVFMSNFLEHLPSIDEAISKLSRVGKVLKNKGKLIIMGPNIRFVSGGYWIFIDHRIPLTDLSLVELLKALDYKLIKAIPKFLPFTTKSKYPQWGWLVKVYLKMPILWKIFGRQYLIICEKMTDSHT